MTTDVVIVGAGLAGLACARELTRRAIDCVVLEADDAVGGRVRTDEVDGFLIDRGFQVLLTAYPEAATTLDYDALDLRPFEPGARVWLGDGFQTVGDPFRRPLQALPTLFADVGSLADKARVLVLRRAVTRGWATELWDRPETTTEAALRERYGFSETIVDRFFRPFLGGVFLDRSLQTSSRAFEFYMRMFTQGDAAVPARGMHEIPAQMAASLPAGAVRLGARVTGLAEGEAHVEGGEAVRCRAVVVATDAASVPDLLPEADVPGWKGTTQLAWAADAPPVQTGTLLLDGVGTGPANNVQVMSNVAPTYGVDGLALVTASVLGEPPGDDGALDTACRDQLRRWFGEEVDGWQLLAVHRVGRALPDLGSLHPPERPVRLGDGRYIAGDWRRNASINGALVCGRHAAEAVAVDLGAGVPA